MKNTSAVKTKIHTIPAVCALFSLILLIGTGALAQAPGGCADEIAQFCPGVSSGGGALRECLEEHDNELSGWCKSTITGATGKAAAACHDDAIVLCGNAVTSILQCLKEKESWLSFDCKVDLGLLPENQGQ